MFCVWYFIKKMFQVEYVNYSTGHENMEHHVR